MRIGAPVISQQNERRPVEGIVAERRIAKFRKSLQEVFELLFCFRQAWLSLIFGLVSSNYLPPAGENQLLGRHLAPLGG